MDTDVVVLGAGMAGLSAAAALRAHGVQAVVIDPRSRVGGRVHTLHDPRTAVPVELGAELVHEGAEALLELVRAHCLGVDELKGRFYMRRRGRLAELGDYDHLIERGLTAAFRAGGRGRGDASMKDALSRARVPEETRELTRAFVEGFHAGPAARVGLRGLAKAGAEGPGRMGRIRVGYGTMAEALASRIAPCLRLGTAATHVTWRKGRVVVGTRGPTGYESELRARAAVVTLPLAVLREGTVAFDPPLEATNAALRGLDTGHVMKITLRFREPFWKETEDGAFFLDPRGPFPTYWTAHPSDAPVLVAWAGGPAADAAHAYGEHRAVEAALDGIADILGVPRRVPHRAIDAWFFHDWMRDPHARGAYSYARVGGAGAAARAARPLDETLFFAGEHTCAAPKNGTVHGAIESGQRAAKEVALALLTGRAIAHASAASASPAHTRPTDRATRASRRARRARR